MLLNKVGYGIYYKNKWQSYNDMPRRYGISDLDSSKDKKKLTPSQQKTSLLPETHTLCIEIQIPSRMQALWWIRLRKQTQLVVIKNMRFLKVSGSILPSSIQIRIRTGFFSSDCSPIVSYASPDPKYYITLFCCVRTHLESLRRMRP